MNLILTMFNTGGFIIISIASSLIIYLNIYYKKELSFFYQVTDNFLNNNYPLDDQYIG